MIKDRLTLSNAEKVLLASLMAFPIVDYVFRHVIGFGGGLWDKGVILLLFILALLRKFETERPETGLKTPITVFVLFGLLMVFFRMPTFGIGFEGFRADYQFMIALFIGYYVFAHSGQWMFAIRVLMGTAVLVGFYGLLQPFLGVQMPAGWVDSGEAVSFRAFSIVQSPNILGSYMALMIPAGIGLFFAEREKRWKIIWGLVVLVLLATLLATLSRGAWMAFAAAIVFLAVLIDRRVLIAVIISGVLVLLFVPQVTDRVTYVFSDTYIERSSEDGRIARWGGALDQVRSEPFFGNGIGHHGGAVAQRNLGVTYVDNYYAKQMAETGLVGLSLFVWVMGAIVYAGFTRTRAMADMQKRWLMRGILTGLVAVMLHNGVENIFESPFMTVYFWFMAGALLALPLLPDKEEVTQHEG